MTLILNLYLFWILYLAITNLQRAYKAKTLRKPALILGYPILGFGLVLDFLMNMIVFSIVFLEIPRQLLVTQRLKLHIKNNDGWRATLANWICNNFLNAFDANGSHCN